MKETLATAPVCSAPTHPREVIGIDLGDRWSRYCVLDQAGMVVQEDRVRTSPSVLPALWDPGFSRRHKHPPAPNRPVFFPP
jgi:hypothetical protein